MPATVPGTPAACTISADAQYRAAERNESVSNEYFDDVLDYFLEAEIPLWQTSMIDGDDILAIAGLQMLAAGTLSLCWPLPGVIRAARSREEWQEPAE